MHATWTFLKSFQVWGIRQTGSILPSDHQAAAPFNIGVQFLLFFLSHESDSGEHQNFAAKGRKSTWRDHLELTMLLKQQNQHTAIRQQEKIRIVVPAFRRKINSHGMHRQARTI